ncbi:Uncharacterized protein SCG7109_AJ_00140 [Chlamydiales bacterium SCGC AG-110-M15]|nr:Uncharacterized protein SCG7109_AJ_00140 [Chlamydiales bacterium SCGC AG-110-M15]
MNISEGIQMECIDRKEEKKVQSKSNCYYIAGPKLWLARWKVGKKAVYDFDLEMWCFGSQKEAEAVIEKHGQDTGVHRAQRFFSAIFQTYKHGSKKEKALVRARSSYEWKKKELYKQEQDFSIECARLMIDRSVVEGGMDDQLSEIELKNVCYLRGAWKELQKEEKELQSLEDHCESIEEGSEENLDGAIEEAVIHELNKKHAVVHTDKYFILTEKPDPVFGHPTFHLETKISLKDLYENQEVECSDGNKRTKANIWLKHPDRRQYKGIIFDPSPKEGYQDYYNIWKGFARKAKQGSSGLYWEHVFENICSGNKTSYRYVRKWLACIFQRPDKVHTAIALCGSQGVGKNAFVEPLGVLFGPHYSELSSLGSLLGRFNNHLQRAVLIHANESFWGGDKREIGRFKAMITDPTCTIEGKGKDVIQVRNFRHIILSSNEEWPIHLDPDDRRVFVLSVSERRKNDREYFKKMYEQLNCQGGYEALLYDLLNEDLVGFDPRKFPLSDDAFEIKLRGSSNAAEFIYEILKEKYEDCHFNQESQLEYKVDTTEFYNDYCQWCKTNGISQVKQKDLGKVLMKTLPSVQKVRPRENGRRKNTYSFPSLELAREEFQKAFTSTEKIWEIEF